MAPERSATLTPVALLCRHSGPQGKVEPLTIIDDPAGWTANDYPNLDEHIYRLTEADVEELDAAVQKAEATEQEIQVPPQLQELHRFCHCS